MPDNQNPEPRIPVTLLTGFLGSGKTSLLNHWLRDPALANAAVIVNEFGEIGIDHALIASSNDNTIELSTGCLCCTVQGDLVETLRELRAKRSAGSITSFDRVLIETTGMADVLPVIQALMTFPVARAFRLNRVLTVVDAVNGIATLAAHDEAVKQVAVADALFVTKTELPAAQNAALQDTLSHINPAARRVECTALARPDASLLDGPDVYDPTAHPDLAHKWLNADSYSTANDHASEDGSKGSYGFSRSRASMHSHSQIKSFCLDFSEPLEWPQVSTWLDALVMAHPDELLRVKGILHVVGHQKPIVIQAVQRLFHPPTELPDGPSIASDSQIVFITNGLSRDYVLEVWNTVRQRSNVPSARAA